MKKIKFARIDSRLIHGQVVTKWSKGLGIDSVYVVDDVTANDAFMKTIFEGSGKTYGFKVKVYTKQGAIEQWNKDQFGNDRVMMIFKDIDSAIEVLDGGIPSEALNIGGVPKKEGAKQINASVYLTNDDLTNLQTLSEEQDLDVFIQTTPDTKVIKISEVKEIAN
jgi:mannose/fructose/N-acetylgalactosamine-specific phosphotransferase system component IIB